ncbi:MAG: FAD-dependent oxidoreductase [Clostridia bacterium]|nr:FAD-dependent oxidoreductase [Clostridia bacterium]
MESIWNKSIERKQFAPLTKDIKTQVLIIGGGIAGIVCAYTLQQAGIDCGLVEADRICNGVTANTTAKITLQHGLIYDKIIKMYGVEAASMYAKAQQVALKRLDRLCRDIACDYKTQDAYVFSRDNRAEIERETAAYERLGIAAQFCENTDLPIQVAAAVRVAEQAQFHPLKFCFSLAEKLKIYENTKIIEIIDGGAITDRGTVFAENIIVATHFPFANKYGAYFLKMYQHRSYVLALENAHLPNGMYVDADMKGLSFREYNGTLLLGGGSHRTGKKGGAWQALRTFAKTHYPRSKEIAFWATQDCMTLDGIPYIGQYSRKLPNVYVATGFNKWGMTSSVAAAMVLTDMIQGKETAYAQVFSPSRSILHPQLAVNAAETALNLITPTAPRCPHLGCALKYNAHEHSWDCPCHGSRFTKDGKLIDNPATDDMSIKRE